MIEKWRKVFLSCFVFGSDRFSEYVPAISDWLAVPRVYVGWEWHNWGIIGLRCLLSPRFLCDICAQNVLFAPASLKWRTSSERKRKQAEKNGSLTIDNYRFFAPTFSLTCSCQPVVNCMRHASPSFTVSVESRARFFPPFGNSTNETLTAHNLYRYWASEAEFFIWAEMSPCWSTAESTLTENF